MRGPRHGRIGVDSVHEIATDRSGGRGPGEDRRRSLRGARPRGLLPRSGGRRVRSAQRADADRDELPRGRLAAAARDDRGAPAREAARRRRLHGDRADRRPRAPTASGSRSSASGSSGRRSSTTPRRSTCTRATSAAAIVSLDQMRPPESWRWAGPEWREHLRSDVTRRLLGVEIQGADPARAGRALGRGLRAASARARPTARTRSRSTTARSASSPTATDAARACRGSTSRSPTRPRSCTARARAACRRPRPRSSSAACASTSTRAA